MAAVLAHGLIALFGEASAGPPCPAQGAHQESCEQSGIDIVAHGVGDGELGRVPVDHVVEGVTPDVIGRLQRPGDRELGRLTCQ